MKEDSIRLWKDYESGLAYQKKIGIADNIPKFIRYYEGNQWANVTENTKNLPRPVVNIVKMICRSKKSSILSNESRIVYKTYDNVNVEKFNHYAEYQQHSMKNEKKNSQATFDAVRKGNWIKHYYWDKESRGKNGMVVGALDCEVIDPLSIIVANPLEHDIQKQEYIIIAKREPIKSVQAKCDTKAMAKLILSDSAESNPYGISESDDSDLATVLTRYFRKDGEVYCEIGCKSGMVKEAFPITPDVEGAKEYLRGTEEDKVLENDYDAPNNNIADAPKDIALTNRTKSYLYPIAWESYEEREGSIYGIGEIEGIISNQNAINFTLGMSLLNVQENAWGKYLVLPNALKQKITNRPGEVITDYSGTGNGIRKMTEQSLQTLPVNLVDKVVELTRNVTGATEVLSGEVLGANMSGTAIANLQNQAQAPIVELRDSYWRFLEQEGRILAQFYKLYYTGQEFYYEDEDRNKYQDTFSSSEYENTDFEVAVEVISGAKASTLADVGMLDNLLQSQSIDAKTYISLYPDSAISNKKDILKQLEKKEQDQFTMLAQQTEQLATQLEQAIKLIQEQQKVVENVSNIIRENDSLKVQLAELKNQATMSINQANEQINAGNDMIQRLMVDDKAKALFESLQDNKAMAEFINKGGTIRNQ